VVDGITIKHVLYEQKYESLIRDFPSKNRKMDQYVIDKADTDKQEGKGVTFLFLNEDENELYGYFILASTSIIIDDESGYYFNLPSVEIKFFAIPFKYSGKRCEGELDGEPFNYSDAMFWQVLHRIDTYSEEILGIEAILLRSTPEAESFYNRHGFHHYKNFKQNLIIADDKFDISCIPLINVFKVNGSEAN